LIELIEALAGKSANKISLPARGSDQLRTKANIEKIKRVLSYQPKVSLSQGLEKTLDWYKKIHEK